MERTPTNVVFFDLDGTLFDHYHSLCLAITAIQLTYPGFAGKNVEELIDKYIAALQQAYDDYMNKVISYDEADTRKIHLFFTAIGLPEPSLDEAKSFRAGYKAIYRTTRRATPGSIETLLRLRKNGYRICVITNGQTEDQTAKAEAIGIRHLVDRIITSEEAGYRKPDRRIFQYAMKQLGAAPQTIMVGDCADSDIKGALDANLTAIMYSPMAQESQRLLFGQQIPVIGHMGQLLKHLDIPSSTPCGIKSP
ncbi:hypothetical protein LCI18_006767 [Fusarium solani-melongenae]|uniref:Uncharacterized protein n=1 Tax=Fusarium solani subsp. cucurbitae TaxID=2747967 RepID=A0ACD3Z3R4_FUSSC|nr:hypothetical protein LCI18_006767 [Fusarium solani-melongenae]